MTRRPRLVTIDVDELRRIVRGEVEAAVHSGPRSPAAWDDPASDASEPTDPTSTPGAATGTSSSPAQLARVVWSDLRRRPTRKPSLMPRAPRSLTRQRPPGLDVAGGEVYACRGCRVEYHDPLAGMWDGPALCRGCGWWLEVVSYDTRWHRRCAARSAS